MPNLENQANKEGGTVEVKGMISAELLGNKETATALINSLSLEPKDETEEERKSRIIRRKLICDTFGISPKNVDQFLKDLKKYVVEFDSATSKTNYKDILDDEKKNNLFKVLGGTLSFASNFIPELKIVELIFKGFKVIIDLSKSNKDFSKVSSIKLEALKIFMDKVNILNNILDKELSEIEKNKETMNKKDFSAYKKQKIKSLKDAVEREYDVKISFEQLSTEKEA